MVELSAAENLENSDSCAEMSVSVGPWLGGRSMASGKPTINAKFARWLAYDSGVNSQ